MADSLFIQVILPLKLEWEPFYRVDEEDVAIGDRVRVCFAGKEYICVVSNVDAQPEIAPAKILPVVCIEREMEKVYPEEIHLWRRVAEYYLCTVGEVYKAAYPSIKVNLEEARAVALAKARERRERLLGSMTEKVGKIQERLQKKQMSLEKSRPGTKAHRSHQESLEKIQTELLRAQEALAAFERSLNPDGSEDRLPWDTESVSLSEVQKTAYEDIRSSFSEGKPVLLHGVTGSGKTQIYIKLAQEVLSRGQGVLYLVPEIALSRQLQDRLYEHFGEDLMVFHSGESAVSRRNTAEKIRKASSGYIVLGTRSSLFLPHHDLGLIIVDEEHDSSYKQDSPAPRYNGRDTALMLSVIHNCSIILGSATPSFEELFNCQYGRHHLVRLSERFHGAQDSEIQIIDTKAERRKRGMEGSFSRKLIEAIRDTLGRGQQVMLLRSRRAWAPALQCENCGDIVKCPHCNVSLTLHKNSGGEFMACHYCGYKAAYSGTCGKCSGQLKGLGAGTQKIEEEAARLFPSARIARLDSDTYADKKQESAIIKDFAAGRIDILIGTQMLAKGFDFSNLSLVAVIAADTLLGMQDFRADEKALQLLEQFRGRCGRREDKGLFIIQTSQPEHPVYGRIHASGEGCAASDSASALAGNNIQGMLNERLEFNFPPFSRIIEIRFRDKYEDRAQRMALKLAGLLNQHFGAAGTRRTALDAAPVTGPYAPVVDKIADQYIRTIRVSLKKDRDLLMHKNALRDIITAFEKSEKYPDHISIDVDPA
jgi:primosomal protein N' (replication factor Y)